MTGFAFFLREGYCNSVKIYMTFENIFLKGDNSNNVKIYINVLLLKIFSSRTAWSISTEFGIKYSWVKGIQICSNEGPCIFQRRNKGHIMKIHSTTFKNL